MSHSPRAAAAAWYVAGLLSAACVIYAAPRELGFCDSSGSSGRRPPAVRATPQEEQAPSPAASSPPSATARPTAEPTLPSAPVPAPAFLPSRLFVDAEVTSLVVWLESRGMLRGAARYVVDFGANDGHGPTEALLTSGAYGALLVEGDAAHNISLHALFPSPAITKTIAYVYPRTALALLHQAGAPMDVQLFKIDMDADDCATIFTLLDGGFRPRIVQLEFDYDLPDPWAFAILPLSAYSYTSHYGFQSCSLAFAVELLRRFDYKLIGVGGTKDALFAHESAMGDLLTELDAHATSYGFSTQAMVAYSANPSHSRQFEVEGRPPAAIVPSHFFAVDPARLTHDIMAATLNASCIMRAVNAGIAHTTCPFPYVLSNSPAMAVDEFVRTIRAALSQPPAASAAHGA